MGQEQSVVDQDVPPETLSDRSLAGLAEYINSGRAKRIVVMTGAGISTAAGIPDFRSPHTGLYANLARLDLPYAEAVFDIGYFRSKPEPFYVLAKELYPGKFHPTISHVFIALLASKGLLFQLFTQNIDCLERRAGVPASLIIEAHGSFATQRCIDCAAEFPDDLMREHVMRGDVPRCMRDNSSEENGEGSTCRGLVKPDIVFFGEQLPRAFTTRQHYASMADLALVMGTSLQVYPFAGLPESVGSDVPRALFNLERVGTLGSHPDDVLCLGDCDSGIRRLADELGWRDELEAEWRRVVGDEEADRQLGRAEERRSGRPTEDEVARLADEVEDVLQIKDGSSSNSDSDSDSGNGKGSSRSRSGSSNSRKGRDNTAPVGESVEQQTSPATQEAPSRDEPTSPSAKNPKTTGGDDCNNTPKDSTNDQQTKPVEIPTADANKPPAEAGQS